MKEFLGQQTKIFKNFFVHFWRSLHIEMGLFCLANFDKIPNICFKTLAGKCIPAVLMSPTQILLYFSTCVNDSNCPKFAGNQMIKFLGAAPNPHVYSLLDLSWISLQVFAQQTLTKDLVQNLRVATSCTLLEVVSPF